MFRCWLEWIGKVETARPLADIARHVLDPIGAGATQVPPDRSGGSDEAL